MWEGVLKYKKILLSVLSSHMGVSCCLGQVEEVLNVAHGRTADQLQRIGGGWLEKKTRTRKQGITCVNTLTSMSRFVLVLTDHPSRALKLLTPMESSLRLPAFPGHRCLQHLAWLPGLEHLIDCTATLK